MPIISEDEVDEILYLARANEIEDLRNYVPTLFPKYGTQPAWILAQAVDAETGNSTLHYASANGHMEMTNYLLSLLPTPADLKALLNKQNASGNTALHWASLNGHLDLCKTLLKAGADASILNFSGHDAVYEAEMNDKQEVAEWLLKEALGLEKGIGREGGGEGARGSGGAEGGEEEEEGDIVMRAGDTGVGGEEAERVADGMRGMDLDAKGGAESKGGG